MTYWEAFELAEVEAPRPTTVYRYFDRRRRLLYVGITDAPLARIHAHGSRAEWWSLVATATFVHYATRAEAVEAERAAIRDELPIYNRAHAVRPHGPPPRVAAARWSTLCASFTRLVRTLEDAGWPALDQ